MSDRGIEQINRIRGKKDAYDILGIGRNDANLDDAKVKKAYKKLALLLHPDKCQEEGAEECFKSVSAAYKCLETQEKRRHYNITGADEDDNNGGMGGFNPANFAGQDELFAQMFEEILRQQGGSSHGQFGQGFGSGQFMHEASMNGGQGSPFFVNLGGMGMPGMRCICMYIYKCVCMYVCMYVCLYVCIYVDVCMYEYSYVCLCKCLYALIS